jgi:hypothetical protein
MPNTIPTDFPVTLVADDGHEYEVTTPAAYVTAVFSLGHKPKPAASAPAPAPNPAPTPEPEKPPVKGSTPSVVGLDEIASLVPRKSEPTPTSKEEGK